MSHNTTTLTLGKPLNDVELTAFYGASGSDKCVVIISDGSDEPIMTGDCKGVTVKDR